MRYTYFTLLLVFLSLLSCGDSATLKSPATDDAAQESPKADPNPAAAGFNLAGSDARAIELADSVVLAYGGRRAYDQNQYFKWNFFGVRELLWDKQNKRVRIDVPTQNSIYLLDYDKMEGQAMVDGKEITQPDSLAKALVDAKSIWINDSYWLVHQFKLKDSGVTLKYVDDTPVDPEKARPSYIIEQTFEDVGDTPGNRYRLYIDKATYKINSWQFFRIVTDEEPAMQTPWQGENEYNGIVLSGDRSGRFQLQDIATPLEVDDSRFTKF
jgi:hypothetical protein